MELDAAKINEYSQMFQMWKDELFPQQEYAHRNECCFAFAHLLAEQAKEKGLLPLKIWCLKSNDSPNVRAHFPAANEQGFETRNWEGYHVALALDLPIYKDSKKTERLVFDPIIFNEPVRASDWNRALNSGEPYVMYSGCKFGEEAKTDTSFFDGSGYWLDKDPAQDLSSHAKRHIKAVNCRNQPLNLLKSPLVMLAKMSSRSKPISNMSARLGASRVQYIIALLVTYALPQFVVQSRLNSTEPKLL